jgi:phage terminase large subunit-like protein
VNTTDPARVLEFAGRFCRLTKGAGAGKPVKLRTWQRALLSDLVAAQPRRAYIQLPRKNGKTYLGALLALYGLLADGEPGAEVYSFAGDREQARLVFSEVRRMVEMDPALSRRLRVLRYSIEDRKTGSVYQVRSADAFRAEGLNPSLVVLDELHVLPDDRLWNVANLGSGTREHPLVVAITTPGVRFDRFGKDTVAYRLYQYGKKLEAGELDDPDFFFRAWEPADPSADHTDPATWAEANPAFGDFLHEADFAAAVRVTPEAEFRTKRCGQWVASSEAWLPHGAWDACAAPGVLEDGAAVVLALDGSWTGDSTALVACTTGDTPRRLAVLGHWERPDNADPHWRVPVEDVEQAVIDARGRLKVVEVACDPFMLQRSMSVLTSAGVPIVEYPNTAARMVPASNAMYEAVADRAVVHDGHAALARHMGAAVVKMDARGARLTKESKGSARRIDLAVAAVMAHDRAAHARANVYTGSIWLS